MISVDSFIDELQKIAAVELSPEEKVRQSLQFAALGGVTMPAVQGLRSRMLSKSWTGGARPGRWLPAQAVTGMLVGGALPTARHMIARSNINTAKHRVAAEREARKLVRGGMQENLRAAQDVPGV